MEPHITFAEAAKLVGDGVTARTMRTWHDKGILGAIRVGRSWRTTKIAVEAAVSRLWQNSSSTALTHASGQSPSQGCAPTSGTSPGTKAENALSEALAASLIYELLQKRDQAPSMPQRSRSGASSLRTVVARDGGPTVGRVIPVK